MLVIFLEAEGLHSICISQKGVVYMERILHRDCQAVGRCALACALSRFAFSQWLIQKLFDLFVVVLTTEGWPQTLAERLCSPSCLRLTG